MGPAGNGSGRLEAWVKPPALSVGGLIGIGPTVGVRCLHVLVKRERLVERQLLLRPVMEDMERAQSCAISARMLHA